MLFDEELSEVEHHKMTVNKFWGRLTDMITGPEHETIYLNKLIEKLRNQIAEQQ
jgi:hypothetical protein